MTDNPKHRCVMPFHHMAMRPNGRLYPCCVFDMDQVPEDFNVSHPDPFNHDYMKWLRQKMRKDEYVHGCKKCYSDEKSTNRSMRTDIISPWQSDGINFGFPSVEEGRGVVKKLTNIDLALSNVCNNKCRMCMPELSTHWYSDAKKLGIPIPKGIVTDNTIINHYDLTSLKFIKILGGEPMLEQDKLIKVLKKCALDNLTLLLVTNVTVLPNPELLALLKKCKIVTIDLSVDSYGKLNDFLRKGSNWDIIRDNIQWYKNNFNVVNMHSVASIYNVNKVHELLDFCQENKLSHDYCTADGPDWMSPSNLPEEVKPWVLEYLENAELKYAKTTSVITSRKIFPLLKDEISQKGDFGYFMRMDTTFNNLRTEHWKTLNPELWNKIEPFII
jgi:MoaA/NifB/PqqE/SkfB family radical SAM enzyme